jgi:transposase InsO family protein
MRAARISSRPLKRKKSTRTNEYRDLDHLRENIAAVIDRYYNCVRLHSTLGYQPPEEFEQAANSAAI